MNNNQAICSCLSSYIGSPPNCRPECVASAECPLNRACVNQKCVDPCPNSCGLNANCRVINHSPICFCDNGYTGDPFASCFRAPGTAIVSEIFTRSIHYCRDHNNSLTIVSKSSRRKYTSGAKRPMLSIPVWSQRSVPECGPDSSLHLLAELSRQPAKL